MPAARNRSIGGASIGGPHPHVSEHPPEIQCCICDRFYQRQECGKDPQADFGKQTGNRSAFLVNMILFFCMARSTMLSPEAPGQLIVSNPIATISSAILERSPSVINRSLRRGACGKRAMLAMFKRSNTGYRLTRSRP